MKILITGGAGFIGSHIAEFYAKKGNDVVVFDNLSRYDLFKKNTKNFMSNWKYLKNFQNINLVKGDVRNFDEIKTHSKNSDAIIHTASQTSVTNSIKNPISDFENNALGTFNVLESARQNDVECVIYCSTNKVYGNNVNKVPMLENEKRYSFEKKSEQSIPEDFLIDLCEHTPYGLSKLTGDLYTQDYGMIYGLKTAVFRMSCIYGARQFGLEDQGWVAWFTIASILGKELTIYGDGKQVRDVLYITDLIDLFDKFINSDLKNIVLNVGGGKEKTLSLLELIEILERINDTRINKKFSDWRPFDQKVYISDISKAEKLLNWKPKVNPEEGIKKLVNWVKENKAFFT